jgi:hypothetical protein
VNAISNADEVRWLCRPLLNVREMLVTTPTILVDQDETNGNGKPRSRSTPSTARTRGGDGFTGRLHLIARESAL